MMNPPQFLVDLSSRLTPLLLIVILYSAHAVAADSADDWAKMKSIKPRGYVCYRAKQPPKVDGRLDEAAWNAAPWTKPFVDIEGDRKPKPRFRTRAKMLWDDEYFYIAAEMEEPHVWGALTKHDSVIYHENDFEVFIDPNGDNHQYYEFEMNALNTTWDLFLPKPYKDGGKYDNSWEIPGLKTEVYVNGTLNDPTDRDRGWTVEIAISWKSMQKHAHCPTPPQEGDQWRVNFSRVEWRLEVKDGKYHKIPNTREDNWVWSPQGIIDMHRPERWGYVQFSTAAPGAARFRVDPTLAARDMLMEIYHHQKGYHHRHKKWAESLAALKVDQQSLSRFSKPPVLQRTKEGFEASLEIALPSGKKRKLQVRQDSRIE